MGWFSKIAKGIKNVFSKIGKAVKKVVKSVGKTAKRVWNGVKGVTSKFVKSVSKLGPLANMAIGFIPGFQSLWAGAGIWGEMAKGAITGYIASGGNIQGALLGAGMGGIGYGYDKLPGRTMSEKIGYFHDEWKNSGSISKALGQTVTKFKDAFKPAQPQPWQVNQKAMELEAYGGPRKKGWTFAEGNPPSLLDQWKDAWKTMPRDEEEGSGYLQSSWNPDTSPLQGVGNIQSASASGEIGVGIDTFNVEDIGLLSKRSLMDEARRIYGVGV